MTRWFPMTTEAYDERMFRAYVECALWAESHSETDESFEQAGYGPDDLALDALDRMRADVAAFAEDNAEDLGAFWTAEQAGHDLWLTRNGHGAGFWDRYMSGEEERAGRRLTEAAKAYGSAYLYLGDDEQVYCEC